MPRGTRFQRDRISKLLGQNKTKLIQKQSQHPKYIITPITAPKPIIKTMTLQQPKIISQHNNPTTPQPQKSTFKSSSYINVIKIHQYAQQKQIQKLSFKCYEDSEVYGDDRLVEYLKQNYDNDHDTPQQQVKYDVNRGIKKLKEQIQRRKNEGSQAAQSQRALSMGSTPPRFIKIRKHK